MIRVPHGEGLTVAPGIDEVDATIGKEYRFHALHTGAAVEPPIESQMISCVPPERVPEVRIQAVIVKLHEIRPDQPGGELDRIRAAVREVGGELPGVAPDPRPWAPSVVAPGGPLGLSGRTALSSARPSLVRGQTPSAAAGLPQGAPLVAARPLSSRRPRSTYRSGSRPSSVQAQVPITGLEPAQGNPPVAAEQASSLRPETPRSLSGACQVSAVVRDTPSEPLSAAVPRQGPSVAVVHMAELADGLYRSRRARLAGRLSGAAAPVCLIA